MTQDVPISNNIDVAKMLMFMLSSFTNFNAYSFSVCCIIIMLCLKSLRTFYK